MAKIRLLTSDAQTITDGDLRFGELLSSLGVGFERWPISQVARVVARRTDWDDSSAAQLMAEFETYRRQRSFDVKYPEWDVVRIRRGDAKTEEAVRRFDRIHSHDDPEVRLIVRGSGVFGFCDMLGRAMLLHVSAGDLISIPPGVNHWFYCSKNTNATVIRFFSPGFEWRPNYLVPDVSRRKR